MILADSNLIIYAASGNYPDLVDWFAENQPVASAVSLVEVLGYHKLTAKEKNRARIAVCRINCTLSNH
jgi:predicted nucleic acid-binding protein